MSEQFTSSLALHVVWHPAAERVADYADALFAHLFEDPEDLTSHGLRIPIWQWCSRSAEKAAAPPPQELPLADAERCAVLVFIDQRFVSTPGWTEWLDATCGALRPGDRLLPVLMFAKAVQLRSKALESNAIRLYAEPEEMREQLLLNRVTHALCRQLEPEESRPVTVFVSHAKADGQPIAQAVRAFLRRDSGVEEFFDAFHIREGDRWREAIRDAASRSLLLAVRTDAYATREWCQYEVLQAKLSGMPVVVLDAFESREARGFPYLGNTPVLRWRPDPARLELEQLLGTLLREALRSLWFPLLVRDVCKVAAIPVPEHVFAAPPELLTILSARRDSERVLVYPDPPLGTDELRVIHDLMPSLTPLTPTLLMAR